MLQARAEPAQPETLPDRLTNAEAVGNPQVTRRSSIAPLGSNQDSPDYQHERMRTARASVLQAFLRT